MAPHQERRDSPSFLARFEFVFEPLSLFIEPWLAVDIDQDDNIILDTIAAFLVTPGSPSLGGLWVMNSRLRKEACWQYERSMWCTVPAITEGFVESTRCA
jgi:hypothetical protein